MPKRYTCVKKITFVNFWFRQLCQYGGWVCCSNERVKTTAISQIQRLRILSPKATIKRVYRLQKSGQKSGLYIDLWPDPTRTKSVTRDPKTRFQQWHGLWRYGRSSERCAVPPITLPAQNHWNV